MLNAEPPCIDVTETTAGRSGESRRATIVWSAVTTCAAATIVSRVSCGEAACPPGLVTSIRNSSTAAIIGAARDADLAERQRRPEVDAEDGVGPRVVEDAVGDHRLRRRRRLPRAGWNAKTTRPSRGGRGAGGPRPRPAPRRARRARRRASVRSSRRTGGPSSRRPEARRGRRAGERSFRVGPCRGRPRRRSSRRPSARRGRARASRSATSAGRLDLLERGLGPRVDRRGGGGQPRLDVVRAGRERVHERDHRPGRAILGA